MKPFRWDLRRREQLGRLLDGAAAPAYDGFLPDLRECAVRVIAAAGDCDLAFVGRSPESLFDYLSGILLHTDWADRPRLVNVSLRPDPWFPDSRPGPADVAAMRRHLASLGLSPPALLTAARPMALIDLVDTGGTFGKLTDRVVGWAEEAGVEVPGVRRKLRFVGVTRRTETSPKTVRWHQHAAWLAAFRRSAVQNVSAPPRLWVYLIDSQAKVSEQNPPWRWSDPELAEPPRRPRQLAALRLAAWVFDTGCVTAERFRFSDLLCRQHAHRFGWCRRLVAQLRRLA